MFGGMIGRRFIVKSFLDRIRCATWYGLWKRFRGFLEYHKWLHSGRGTPPPHRVKQQLILRCLDQSHCSVLVETGTFRGDMLQALDGRFRRMYSIELHPELHERAKLRFAGRSHIQLLQGDSEFATFCRNSTNPPCFGSTVIIRPARPQRVTSTRPSLANLTRSSGTRFATM